MTTGEMPLNATTPFLMANASNTTAIDGNGNNTNGLVADYSDTIIPLVQAELSIIVLLVLSLLAQWWRLRKYAKYNVVKKLQLRFFRSSNLTKEAKKFFGNLSVRFGCEIDVAIQHTIQSLCFLVLTSIVLVDVGTREDLRHRRSPRSANDYSSRTSQIRHHEADQDCVPVRA